MTKSINFTLCVVMASHNRRKQTLESLAHLETAMRCAPSGEVQIVLVEDGSSDGTEAAVRRDFPSVRIIEGSGNLYWNGAMRKGLEVVMEEHYDYYMLLNDDTLLNPDSIQRMVVAHYGLGSSRAIIVGTVVDPDSGELTYGGRLRSSQWHPLRFEGIVKPDPVNVLPCDTFNGNCVLIPNVVIASIGNLSSRFTHLNGDFDLGLRAKAEGIELLVAPGFVGTCKRDRPANLSTPFDKRPIEDLWSFATHPKKRPIRERIAYFRRHGGVFWWLLVPGPYIRRTLINLRRTFT